MKGSARTNVQWGVHHLPGHLQIRDLGIQVDTVQTVNSNATRPSSNSSTLTDLVNTHLHPPGRPIIGQTRQTIDPAPLTRDPRAKHLLEDDYLIRVRVPTRTRMEGHEDRPGVRPPRGDGWSKLRIWVTLSNVSPLAKVSVPAELVRATVRVVEECGQDIADVPLPAFAAAAGVSRSTAKRNATATAGLTTTSQYENTRSLIDFEDGLSDTPSVVLLAKQALDIVLSLIALTPLLVATFLIVRLSSPGPALFMQERIGRGGNRSRRSNQSMYADAEQYREYYQALNECDGPVFSSARPGRDPGIRVPGKSAMDRTSPSRWIDKSCLCPVVESPARCRPSFLDVCCRTQRQRRLLIRRPCDHGHSSIWSQI